MYRSAPAARVGAQVSTMAARLLDRITPPTPDADSSVIPSTADRPWPKLHPDALHGIAGEFVKRVAPHTEADPVALLTQFLVLSGNAIGRGPYFPVEGDRHRLNENVILIGDTSSGRKGTSLSQVKRVLADVDDGWSARCLASGLSSGEGLTWAVRDSVEKVNRKGETEVVDSGVSDKRLTVVESEFVSVLRAMAREGCTPEPGDPAGLG